MDFFIFLKLQKNERRAVEDVLKMGDELVRKGN